LLVFLFWFENRDFSFLEIHMVKVLRFNDLNLFYCIFSWTKKSIHFFARSLSLKQLLIMDFIDENGLTGIRFFTFWVLCFGFFNQLCVLDFPLYQVLRGREKMWNIWFMEWIMHLLMLRLYSQVVWNWYAFHYYFW